MIQGYTSPNANEVLVKRSRLAELERKAKAHDVYMRAMNRYRVERVAITDPNNGKSHQWVAGWLSALNRFAELILEEGRDAE